MQEAAVDWLESDDSDDTSAAARRSTSKLAKRYTPDPIPLNVLRQRRDTVGESLKLRMRASVFQDANCQVQQHPNSTMQIRRSMPRRRSALYDYTYTVPYMMVLRSDLFVDHARPSEPISRHQYVQASMSPTDLPFNAA